jgi:hypothetical protein
MLRLICIINREGRKEITTWLVLRIAYGSGRNSNSIWIRSISRRRSLLPSSGWLCFLTPINDPTLLNLRACLVINLSMYFQDMAYRLFLHVEEANVSLENFVQLCSWLRHCATSRQLVGSIPDGVSGIFRWQSFWPHSVPGEDSASNRKGTRNISWG